MFLEVAQVPCHHHHVCAPFFFKSYQHAHSYRVHSSLSHAVKAVTSPFEDGFHPSGVVEFVVLPVIGLLKAYHPVQAVGAKACVVFGL